MIASICMATYAAIWQTTGNYLLTMSSKLQEHAELVSAQLQKGLSYSQIVLVLHAHGCITTRQNLISWLKRRAARIQSRLYLIDAAAVIQASRQQVPSAPVHEPAEKKTVADVAASAPAEEEPGFISNVIRRGSIVRR